jgi:gliding motility-associated protein GldM
MAGQKDSPRQKMIGMMYLVLTALLALNISKDILDAFVIVNESLAASSETTGKKMNALYSDFELARSIDPKKVDNYWIKSQEARRQATELNTFIDSIKTTLISKTENVERSVADTLSMELISKKDDYDTPTNILVGKKEDGSSGMANILKNKITEYQRTMRELLSEQDRQHFNDRINLSDRKLADQTSTWETNNFYHTPLVASLVILSKLQMDVADVEYDVVSKLYRSFNKKDFFFDTIAATVLPQSNYVLLGEEYASDIIVAAYSTTRSPKVRIGKLNKEGNELISEDGTCETENGKGIFRRRANAEGIFTYEGMVDLVNSEGGIQSYPFRSEYIVARPSLVVSPTQMNVLYKGIENPVAISVPGVPSERITATITGGNKLKKTGSGQYMVEMSPQSPNTVDIIVSATMVDGTVRNMGKMEFRAKRLPAPFSAINGKTGSVAMTPNEVCAQLGLSAKYDANFAFNLNCTVNSFRVLISDNQGQFVLNDSYSGSRFDSNLKNKLCAVKKGYRITFEDIKAVGSDEVVHTLVPVIITVR